LIRTLFLLLYSIGWSNFCMAKRRIWISCFFSREWWIL